MTHVRQSLRAAVIAAVTGLASTGSRVYAARVYPLQAAQMPALSVATVGESAEPRGMGFADVIERVVTVEVTGHARETAGLADTLDTIAEEVETALGAGVSVGGVTVALDYAGAEINFSGEVDQPVGTVAMRWTALLFTLSNAPGTLVQV